MCKMMNNRFSAVFTDSLYINAELMDNSICHWLNDFQMLKYDGRPESAENDCVFQKEIAWVLEVLLLK